ncbi:MAG TPA: hypothetical protein PK230_11485, partial [Chitinophagales bacterium]|nr:hypothetical protein [Chitinophagales bacterium]
YFSYVENELAKCVFYSLSESPKVIGTAIFDSTYLLANAKLDLVERDFSPLENNLYILRKQTIDLVKSDSLFKFYQNTNFNFIPIITGNEKKVYILTGTQQQGVVILGNDYLLTFDSDNQLITKKAIHQNIIPIEFANGEADVEIVGSLHNHSPETGDFITATDICTLMLYAKFAKWKSHNVISEKYLNIWDCEKNSLVVVPVALFDKIDKEEKSPKEKKEKKKK